VQARHVVQVHGLAVSSAAHISGRRRSWRRRMSLRLEGTATVDLEFVHG
jgi:hypothetical protein